MIGYGGVGVQGFRGVEVELADETGVKLLERDDRAGFCVHRGLETAAIFEHVFASIPGSEPEIQHFFLTQPADAAFLCAESVDKPGDFCQSRHLENSETLSPALQPIVGSRRTASLRLLRTLLCYSVL